VIGLLFKLALLPFRVGVGATAFSFKAGYKTGSLLGYRRLFVLGTGIAVGLLVAPVPGRELRARLRDRLEGGAGSPPSDVELADLVRFELTHSPRTWNLKQPDVEVAAGRVTLKGEVADAADRTELERTAASVKGVTVVDNQLAVSVG
jgi:hypothetical protein